MDCAAFFLRARLDGGGLDGGEEPPGDGSPVHDRAGCLDVDADPCRAQGERHASAWSVTVNPMDGRLIRSAPAFRPVRVRLRPPPLSLPSAFSIHRHRTDPRTRVVGAGKALAPLGRTPGSARRVMVLHGGHSCLGMGRMRSAAQALVDDVGRAGRVVAVHPSILPGPAHDRIRTCLPDAGPNRAPVQVPAWTRRWR